MKYAYKYCIRVHTHTHWIVYSYWATNIYSNLSFWLGNCCPDRKRWAVVRIPRKPVGPPRLMTGMLDSFCLPINSYLYLPRLRSFDRGHRAKVGAPWPFDATRCSRTGTRAPQSDFDLAKKSSGEWPDLWPRLVKVPHSSTHQGFEMYKIIGSPFKIMTLRVS